MRSSWRGQGSFLSNVANFVKKLYAHSLGRLVLVWDQYRLAVTQQRPEYERAWRNFRLPATAINGSKQSTLAKLIEAAGGENMTEDQLGALILGFDPDLRRSYRYSEAAARKAVVRAWKALKQTDFVQKRFVKADEFIRFALSADAAAERHGLRLASLPENELERHYERQALALNLGKKHRWFGLSNFGQYLQKRFLISGMLVSEITKTIKARPMRA